MNSKNISYSFSRVSMNWINKEWTHFGFEFIMIHEEMENS